MLNLRLPKPYPGELIGSVVSRGAIYNNLSGSLIVERLHEEYRYRMSYFLPVNLVGLAEHIGMDAKELLWKHTVFPYVMAFRKQEEITRWEGKILNRQGNPGRLNSAGTNGLKWLQYCQQCSLENVRKYGESYWHLHHNLPAVHVCTKHGIALTRSNVPARGPASPYDKGLPHHQKPLVDDDAESWEAWIGPEVAEALAAAAANHVKRPPGKRSAWGSTLALNRRVAMAKGYSARGGVATRKLSEHLIEFYGEKYLAHLNATFDPMKQSWPGSLVGEFYSGNVWPVKAALFDTFLKMCPDGPKNLGDVYGSKGRPAVTTDEEMAEQVRLASQDVNARGVKTTAIELMKGIGRWSTYRHDIKRFPLTKEALLAFRLTASSRRYPHGYGHLRDQKELQRVYRETFKARKALALAATETIGTEDASEP